MQLLQSKEIRRTTTVSLELMQQLPASIQWSIIFEGARGSGLHRPGSLSSSLQHDRPILRGTASLELRKRQRNYSAALITAGTAIPSIFSSSRTVGNTLRPLLASTILDEYSVQTLIQKFLRASHLNVKLSCVSRSAFGTTHNGNPSPCFRKRP